MTTPAMGAMGAPGMSAPGMAMPGMGVPGMPVPGMQVPGMAGMPSPGVPWALPLPQSTQPAADGRGRTAARGTGARARRTAQGSPPAQIRRNDAEHLNTKVVYWGLVPPFFQIELLASVQEAEFNFLSLTQAERTQPECLHKLIFLAVLKQPGDPYECSFAGPSCIINSAHLSNPLETTDPDS